MPYGAIQNQTFDGYTKEQELSSLAKQLLGLPDEATPSDAFIALKLADSGSYIYGITLQYPDGTPWAGATLTGVENPTGGSVVTDENGYALCLSSSTTPTVGVTSPWIDIANVSQQITKGNYLVTYATVKAEFVSILNINGNRTITSDQFSHFTKYVDVTIVGGGAGGSGSFWGGSSPLDHGAGAGGGGGYVTTQTNISLEENGSNIEFVIGSGGSGGSGTTSSEYRPHNGGSGGTSYAYFRKTQDGDISLTLTAKGGTSTSGNGRGAVNTSNQTYDGTDGKGYIFDDSSLGLAGGGGGASSSGSYNGVGGKPFGADYLENAKGFGGGGSGARYASSSAQNYRGNSGGNGGAYIRFKSTAT